MPRHTDFYKRLDDLEQRVNKVRSAVHAPTAESDAQLQIAQQDAALNPSVENARQQVVHADGTARTKWAQTKGGVAAKVSDVKANIDKWNRQVNAKAADANADWAEGDAAEDLDFADRAVENAQLAMLRAIHARNHAHVDPLAHA